MHGRHLGVASWKILVLALLAGTSHGKLKHWRSPFSHHIGHARSSGLDANGGDASKDPSVNVTDLQARSTSGRFTFYNTGLGACGKYNGPGDFIVALNSPQWEGGKHCFEMITMLYKGKKTQAQIVDLCPSCPWGALDLSRGLFDFFANEALGVLQGEWYFGSDTTQMQAGSFKGHKSKPKPKPKPKQKPMPKPTPKPKPKAKTKPTLDQGILGGLNSIASTAQDVVGPTSSASIPVESALAQSNIADLFVPTSVSPEPSKTADTLSLESSVRPQCSSLNEVNLAVINMGALLQSEHQIEPGSGTTVPTKK